MNIQRHIARTTVLLATLLMLNACSDEHTNEYFADNSHTLLRVSLNHFSAEGQAQPVSGENRIERMDAKLKLTDEQKEQIRMFCAEFNARKLTPEERKKALAELNEQIASVLTAEQETIYRQMQKEAAARRKAEKKKDKTE